MNKRGIDYADIAMAMLAYMFFLTLFSDFLIACAQGGV